MALKVLRNPDKSQTLVKRFLREGWLLQRLEHRGLPRCLDVLEEPQPTLVMELLHGRTLSQAIRQSGPRKAEEVLRIGTELLDVIGFLHDQGIVHRDIKSSNIHLGEGGCVRLLDLGLAMNTADPLSTTLGDVLGTYAYMAPEQIAGIDVDQRCDLYSLGVTLYEALSGVRPFHALDTMGYLRAHWAGNYRSLCDIVPEAPVRLTETIHHLMARDPSARPHSAAMALALLAGRGGLNRELHRPVLVGRWAAQGAIEGVLDAGGVVHLVGELGSGIGRVAQLAVELASRAGVECIAVRCRASGIDRSVLHQISRSLSQLAFDSTTPGEGKIRDALIRVMDEGRCLLLVEDLHRASDRELDVIGALAEHVPGLSLVTIGLARKEALPGRIVDLRPLKKSEVHSMVSAMLATTAPPGDLVGLLMRESGGLPALVVTAVRELHAQGLLKWEGVGEGGEPVWHLDPKVSILPLKNFQSRFQAMLEDLEPSAHKLLQVLAIAGEPLPLSVALDAASVDQSGVDAGNLVKLGLVQIRNDEKGEWIYIRRPVLGDMVATGLSSSGTARLHRALARSISSFEQQEWVADRVALHRALGSFVTQAVPALLNLAENALANGDHQRALDALSYVGGLRAPDPEQSGRFSLLRGEALLSSGRWREAGQAFSDARARARETGKPILNSRAMLGLARACMEQGDCARCEDLSDAIMAIPGESPEPLVKVNAMILKAEVRALEGDYWKALMLLRSAAAEATSRGMEEPLALAMYALARQNLEQDLVDRAEKSLSQVLKRGMGQVSASTKLRFLVLMAGVGRRRGFLGQAHGYLGQAESICKTRAHAGLEALIGVEKAALYLAAGDLDWAAEALLVAQGAADTQIDALTRLHLLSVRGELRLARHDRQAALAAFYRGERLASRMKYKGAMAFFRGMSAVLTADARPFSKALEQLARLGTRRWMVLLLREGALVAGDPTAMEAAIDEARQVGDLPLRLRCLHAMGGREARAEAWPLARTMMEHSGSVLGPVVKVDSAVRWAAQEQFLRDDQGGEQS